jgi:deoxyribodipyrimidine photo-lyase
VAGVAWCFGRYDRPWPPDKPVIGVTRPMSSENTRRKLDLEAWLRRWGPGSG